MHWLAQSDPPEVTPIEDFYTHMQGMRCWCHPRLDEGVIIHNSMDKREEYENGRKKS